jgi:Arc-like DNA binding domain
LRLPETLRRNLSQAAKSNRHSMNSEIVSRLDKSFQWGNLMALMREHINNTAIKVAEQVVQQLRQQNRDSDNDKAS